MKRASRPGGIAAFMILAELVGSGSCARSTGQFGVQGGAGGASDSDSDDVARDCDPSLALCGGVCVDRSTDAKNCGACGSTCKAGEVCVGAACACAPGTTQCGGACADITSDAAHCGMCGNLCPEDGGPNTKATCEGSTCGIACAEGFSDCNQLTSDGCEVSTASDVTSCGTCGNPCPTPAHVEVFCKAGVCATGACTDAFADCDGNAANGCEVNLSNDPANCGACGNACPVSFMCVAGACANIDLTNVFASYPSEGRNVHLWKTDPCVDLASHVDFCQQRGLHWWKPKSQADAQELVTFAYNLDVSYTWIQVHGITTDQTGLINGFPVAVDGPGCVESSSSGFSAFRKWACSFCDPEAPANGGKSCCWDQDNPYDWFVCEE